MLKNYFKIAWRNMLRILNRDSYRSWELFLNDVHICTGTVRIRTPLRRLYFLVSCKVISCTTGTTVGASAGERNYGKGKHLEIACGKDDR